MSNDPDNGTRSSSRDPHRDEHPSATGGDELRDPQIEAPLLASPGEIERRDGSSPPGEESGSHAPPYTLYRTGPRALFARLRGHRDSDLGPPRGRRPGKIAPRRVLKWLALALLAWLLLSVVLFITSAQTQQGSVPAAAQAELTPGGNMLTSANTILILGTEQAPKGWNWRGDVTSDAGSNSDTIMLWRVGGGVSRRLSIPRDTVTSIPGHGEAKINAAYSYGGPALALKTVEQFTGVKINHVIVVNLANFPPFIDAIGGIDLRTDRICSDISGGTKNGGWSLYLSAGTHHLDGARALVLARTRENKCNPAETDLTRVMRQQQILNAIKAKLESPSAFFHLPWASWDAPQVLRSDMGGFTLLSLFAAAEIGGSAPVKVLRPTGAEVLADGGEALTVTPGAVHSAVAKLISG